MMGKMERLLRDVQMRQLSVSMEACNLIFQRLLKDKASFKFSDGRIARLKPFVEPHFDKNGHPECGVDVVMPNGHIEFNIRVSGYGGCPEEYAHFGDPCKYCNTPHDEVMPGACPARIPKEDSDG